MNERITTPPACASPDGAPSLRAPTPAAGAQTGRVVAVVTATDWPGYGHLAGRRDPVSIQGTADLLVDGTAVTVALWLDDGTPYVADAPEWLTIEQCEAIDVAVAAAWDERCADEAAESYDTGRGWREVA